MKIFFLNTTLNIGGAERMHYEMLKHLDSGVFVKKVCCLYGPGTIGRALIAEGMDLRCGLIKNKYDLIGFYRLFQLLKNESADVLCIQNSPLTLFWGFIFGRILKVPCIVTVVHNMKDVDWGEWFKSRIVNSFIMRRLDRIIVVSKARMNSLIMEYNLNPEKFALIHNGIDTDRVMDFKDREVLRQEIGIGADEKVIGMVGRLVKEKAYDIFLKAAQRIIMAYPKVRFLIIGEGRERPNLERLSRVLGISERVIFLGERQDALNLIRLFDVAVLSSRIESFPIALLEYMACSKAIVATNVGGNTEIIMNGEAGIVIPSEDFEALSKAVETLLNDKKKAEEMGELARKMAEVRFSLKHMISRTEIFFLECTEGAFAEKRACL